MDQFTVEELKNYRTQGDNIAVFLGDIAKRICAAEGRKLAPRATYIDDDWSVYGDYISVNFTYYVCGCCEPDTEYVQIPLEYLSDPEFESKIIARVVAETQAKEDEEDAKFEAKVRDIM